MSQIQLFNDTWHIRNQRLPVWTVVGDLLYFDNTGWHLRTAVTDPINGYVAVLDAWTDTWVISVANWVTTWSWGWSSNQVIYEDITNPAKTTNVSWGKRVGKIKWAAWWASLQYEWDSFFIDCFNDNVVEEIEYYYWPDTWYNSDPLDLVNTSVWQWYTHDKHRIGSYGTISNATVPTGNIWGIEYYDVIIPLYLPHWALTAPYAAPIWYKWVVRMIFTTNCYVSHPNGLHQVSLNHGLNHAKLTWWFSNWSVNHEINFISESDLWTPDQDKIYFRFWKEQQVAPFWTNDANNIDMNANRVRLTYILRKS
jgi:hypothetical protein